MGIISFVKNAIYDSRLNKASRLLDKGNKGEAIEIYTNLLGKHPIAPERLAGIYFDDSKISPLREQISLFEQVLSIAIKGEGIVWDKTGYNRIVEDFAKSLYSSAENLQKKGQSKEAYEILENLRKNRKLSKTKKSQTLYIDAAYGSASNKGSVNINALQKVILALTDKELIFEYLDRFILYIKEYSKSYIEYSSWYILTKAASSEIVVEKFNKCWKEISCSDDERKDYVECLLNKCSSNIGTALFEFMVHNSGTYLKSSAIQQILIRWATLTSDTKSSLDFLVQLNNVGLDVQKSYETNFKAYIKSIPLTDRITAFNNALALYPTSTSIINEKLSLVKDLAKSKQYKAAHEVCNELIGKHSLAEYTKAKIYVSEACDESNPEVQLSLVAKGRDLLAGIKVKDAEIDKVLDKIDEITVDAAKTLHKQGTQDRAYEIVRSGNTANFAKQLSEFFLTDAPSVSEPEAYKYFAKAIEELEGRWYNIHLYEKYKKLWAGYIQSYLGQLTLTDDCAVIKTLEDLYKKLSDEAQISNDEDFYKPLKESVLEARIKRMYLHARNLEISGDIKAAALKYREIRKLEVSSIPVLSDYRYAICRLKSDDPSVISSNGDKIDSLLSSIQSVYEDEKNDLAYRYALQLLKAGLVDKALSVLNDYLPQEETLKKACEYQYIIKGLECLDNFNQKIKKLHAKTLSSDEAVYMVNHMLDFADDVKYVVSLSRQKLAKYRKALKNYAILKLFEEGRYDIAFAKIKKEHPDYLEDLTSLRNIAIICLNMAESKMLNNSNYEEVIAIWLTAIYQEQLFIKSLDYTSWDDNFTFSLADAYGHFDIDAIGNLPDNVNFNEPDGSLTNVAIKDVQQNLLNRFESAISNNNDFISFFNEQKEAMDGLIALNLDEKCRMVAPHLAEKSEDIMSEIKSAFETDRNNMYDNYEDVLSVGYKYGLKMGAYLDYYNVANYYKDCIRATDAGNGIKIRSAFTKDKMRAISIYNKKWSALTSYVRVKMSSLQSSTKAEFNKTFEEYISICDVMEDSTITFPFANFVMQFVVSRVNNNDMKKSEAAKYILPVYLLDKQNSRIKENLITLFEMLVRENASESRTAVTEILDKAKKYDSVLYSRLNAEYEEAQIDIELNNIVDKVNSNTMKASSALDKVYKLYCSHPANARVCENLAQLCNMCIMQYVIGQESGYVSVQKVLDALKNNKSPEFQRHTRVFRESYNAIWQQLPSETKVLLGDTSNPLAALIAVNQTLNDKVLALKRGLEYYKSLR